MVPSEKTYGSSNPFIIPHRFASFLFVSGTAGIEWLETWRQTKILDRKNKYVSLESVISTLRKAGKSKKKTSGYMIVAAGIENTEIGIEKAIGVTNDTCVLFKHRHKNKKCYKQYPELRPKKNKGKYND